MAYKGGGKNITRENVIDALLAKDSNLMPQKAARLSYRNHIEHVAWFLARSHAEKLTSLHTLQIATKLELKNIIPEFVWNYAINSLHLRKDLYKIKN